jgi:hypothetical protein
MECISVGKENVLGRNFNLVLQVFSRGDSTFTFVTGNYSV